jgi:hypothetical protein
MHWVHLRAAEMSKQSWGGRIGGVDLGTDLPYGCRALLMYLSPSIDLVQRFHSLRVISDSLSEERERWLSNWAKNTKIVRLPANQSTESHPESWVREPRGAQSRCKRDVEVGMNGWGRGAKWIVLYDLWENEPNVIELQLDALFLHQYFEFLYDSFWLTLCTFYGVCFMPVHQDC